MSRDEYTLDTPVNRIIELEKKYRREVLNRNAYTPINKMIELEKKINARMLNRNADTPINKMLEIKKKYRLIEMGLIPKE